MNVKPDEERKSKVLKVRLNDKEFAKLKQYTEESGLRSMSKYIFNSILATPIIELTDEEHERAECVYIQLLHGLDECSDEDE